MRARSRIPNRRWVIAGLLVVVTPINYTDRMTLSVLIGEVSKDLKLNTEDYGQRRRRERTGGPSGPRTAMSPATSRPGFRASLAIVLPGARAG